MQYIREVYFLNLLQVMFRKPQKIQKTNKQITPPPPIESSLRIANQRLYTALTLTLTLTLPTLTTTCTVHLKLVIACFTLFIFVYSICTFFFLFFLFINYTAQYIYNLINSKQPKQNIFYHSFIHTERKKGKTN